jgi:hypothetical protein
MKKFIVSLFLRGKLHSRRQTAGSVRSFVDISCSTVINHENIIDISKICNGMIFL